MTTHIEPPAYTVTVQYSEPLVIVEPKKPEPSRVTLCNCWLTLKEFYYNDLPSTNYILNNLSKEVGDIAVFYYKNSGLYHYAKVTNVQNNSFTIDEGNFKHCKRTQRTLPMDYPHLIGFFNIK